MSDFQLQPHILKVWLGTKDCQLELKKKTRNGALMYMPEDNYLEMDSSYLTAIKNVHFVGPRTLFLCLCKLLKFSLNFFLVCPGHN